MRDRTADLNTASVALSQLSYSPKSGANFKVSLDCCQGKSLIILTFISSIAGIYCAFYPQSYLSPNYLVDIVDFFMLYFSNIMNC